MFPLSLVCKLMSWMGNTRPDLDLTPLPDRKRRARRSCGSCFRLSAHGLRLSGRLLTYELNTANNWPVATLPSANTPLPLALGYVAPLLRAAACEHGMHVVLDASETVAVLLGPQGLAVQPLPAPVTPLRARPPLAPTGSVACTAAHPLFCNARSASADAAARK